MHDKKRKAHGSCNYNMRQCPGLDNHSITDYERGSIWAAFAFIGMFVFLSIGCIVWGW